MSVIVLKFGSSVLPGPEAVPLAVSEIYRHVRRGRGVVAVVSAFRGVTDRLDATGRRHGIGTGAAHAEVLATGELEAAALLASGVARAGLRIRLLGPADLGIVAEGDPLDASPARVDAARVVEALSNHAVVVVPGYAAVDEHGSTVVLGRGGSDLSAVTLGAALDAEVVLLKDVGWVYEWAPGAGDGPTPRAFADLAWDDALALTDRAIQPKAIAAGRAAGRSFRFAGLGSDTGTQVGPGPSRLHTSPPASRAAPLRVAVAGAGVVGGGVIRRLAREPRRFDLVGVAVRDPAGRGMAELRGDPATGLDPLRVSTDAPALLDTTPDVLVELIGGVGTAHALVAAALRRGVSVVTANKALLAAHGESLHTLAREHGAALLTSASVGGALPALETLARAAALGPVRRVRGVLNGTSTFVLGRLSAGATLEQALADAISLGYAEADASLDLSGADAAHKLAVLAQALGATLPFDAVRLDTIDERTAERIARAGPLRQVACLTLGEGRGAGLAHGQVTLVPVGDDPADALAGLTGAENAIEVELADGRRFAAIAAGAGRWPTTESVTADLNDLFERRRGQSPRRAAHSQNADTHAVTDERTAP